MTDSLSTIHPDFEDLVAQLKVRLSGKASWIPLLDAGTGTILIEAVAATGTMLMGAIQNTYEEQNTDTAKLDSSLKAIARTLGVRLTRRTPASATVTLTLASQPSQYVIPAYSQFAAPGARLFNRTAIVIPALATSITVTLYEGVVRVAEFTGSGQPFQIYYVNVPGFTISDADVKMTIDGQPYSVVTDAIWHYANSSTVTQYVVQDRTLPTGELELLFGNLLYGSQPSSTAAIVLTYVVTNGEAGNSLGFLGQRVVYEADPLVSGLSSTPLLTGANEPQAEIYRASPLVFAAYGRGVSLNDHEAIALQYSNVVDARFFGQRSIAPTVKDYMNVVYVYTLQSDSTQFTTPEFAAFKEWLLPKAMPLDYVSKLAVTIPVVINYDVYIKGTGDPDTVRANINANVARLFTPRNGFLGRNMYLSDIYDAVKDADSNIDYVIRNSPSTDIICRIDPPETLTLTPLVTGGANLVPGNTYEYSVSAVNSQGETFASQFMQIILPSGFNSVRVSWTAVPGATFYRVYGNTSAAAYQIGADVPAGTLQRTDTVHSTVVTTPINLVNTSGLYYVTLSSLTLNLNFTVRK